MAESFLERILAAKREEVAKKKAERPIAEWDVQRPDAFDFRRRLAYPGIALIAEIKRRSPSKGDLAPDADAGLLARAYREAGASAVSVLTDEAFFGAREGDIQRASAASGLPILRKDFVIDRYQVFEADQLGASAVLLIVAALDDATLAELIAVAGRIGQDALVEVHTRDELERAKAAGASILGINNRDLTTFEVNLQTTFDLLPHAKGAGLVVAESGVRTPRDVKALADAGVDAVLIGEALVTAPDPRAKAKELFSLV